VDNSGTITGINYQGIVVQSGLGKIYNNFPGVIDGNTDGISLGADGEIENNFEITGGNIGIRLVAGGLVTNYANSVITGSGTAANHGGIYAEGGLSTIENFGMMVLF